MRALVSSLMVTAMTLGACNAPPPAGSTAAAMAGNQTSMTTDLAIQVFFDLCAVNPTREADRQAWLRSNNFQPLPPPQAISHLTSGPGTVWMRDDPMAVGFPIVAVTRPRGVQCEVRSSVAEPDLAARLFKARVENLAMPGLVIRKETDDQTAPGGGPGFFVSYRVGAAPIEKGGFHFSLSARPSPSRGPALFITAAPAAPQ